MKHSRTKSPLLAWIMQRTQCDEVTAFNAFESAKQARYLIHKDAAWHFDANAGFDHWNKKPTAAPAPAPAPTDPEPETLEQMAARMQAAYHAAKARALEDCRTWPRMSKLDAIARGEAEWPALDNGQRVQLFRALATAGAIHTGPDWIQGADAA